MKFLASLLAIYFLALTIFPCTDGDPCAMEQQQTCIEQPMPMHAEHQDACTPLCHCTCCGVSVIIGESVNLEVALLPETLHNSFWKSSFISHDYSDIWQPPKIA